MKNVMITRNAEQMRRDRMDVACRAMAVFAAVSIACAVIGFTLILPSVIAKAKHSINITMPVGG